MTATRTIAHMDLDTFFVSVERLQNPTLIGKPVLVGGASDRGVVASCSYEARGYGIHAAMPMKMARQLCPEAIIVRGDHERYSHYSNIVSDIIEDAVPLYEKMSIDEFYMDLSGMDRFFGSYKWASELRQRIMRESGLPLSFAMSINKTVAKIGTGQAKPNGQLQIEYGREKEFLAPLSVRKIPMVGEKTYQILRSMGIEKIETIQQMPSELMQQVLGESGLAIWRKANALDDTPVLPYCEQQSLSTETTFERDTMDLAHLHRVLIHQIEQLTFQLRSSDRLTGCITVKLRYSDFNTHTMQLRIPYTALDHVLIAKSKELFAKLYTQRLQIRLIGVRFSHLIQGAYQFDLFDDTKEKVLLYAAMDKLRKRFGKDTIQRAGGIDFKDVTEVKDTRKAKLLNKGKKK